MRIRTGPFRAAAILGLCLACAVSAEEAPKAPLSTVAVMEFAPTRTGPDQAENAWLTKGLSDLLIGDLGQLPELRLVTREHALMMAEECSLQTRLYEAGRMPEEEIRKLTAHLKVDLAVFGTYTVEGAGLKLRTQIINASNGTVIASFSHDGELAAALDAEKALARKMMAFFGGGERPGGPVPLPKWTDSTAAARRLYEGVAAFDAGLYNVAWLRFRQALASDPKYADARYWGARMHYYRQEYGHARIEYRRFITDFPSHGRVGDAVMEYVHTHEGGATSPTKMLALYQAFRERGFRDVQVHNQVEWVGVSPLSDWLVKREQQALVYEGRLKEAFDLLDRNLREHAAEKGQWLSETRNLLSAIAEAAEDRFGERLLSDQLPYKSIPLTLENPEAGEELANLTGKALRHGPNYRLLAPPGYAVRKVKATIISTGDPQNMSVCRLQIRRYRYVDINSCGTTTTNPTPRRETVTEVVMPPGCTWFYLRPEFDGNNYARGPQPNKARFDAWKIVAEFEPLGQGRVHVNVSNTHEFRVLVDDVYSRCFNGSLGLLPEGEHRLRVECMWPRKPWGYLPYETNIVVTPGKELQVRVDLKLTNSVREAGWRDPVGIALDYPTWKHRPRRDSNWRNGAPVIAVNPRTGARTAVWAHLDDLWFSVCTNGTDWSAPDTLPAPVNSAHVDVNPRLLFDDRGRYCLLFLSDRGQERNLCAYASWSRDLKAWSRPVLVSPLHYRDLDLIQDREGNYLLACAYASGPGAPAGGLALRTSPDLVNWSEPQPVSLERPPEPPKIGVPVYSMGGLEKEPETVALRQDEDGLYHLAWTQPDRSLSVYYSQSRDLKNWSPIQTLPVQKEWWLHPVSLSMEVLDGLAVIATCTRDGQYAGYEVFTLHGLPYKAEKPAWKPLVIPSSAIVGMPSLSRDPLTRELVLAWQVGDLQLNPSRSSGPVYVMSGVPQFVPDPPPVQHARFNQVIEAALKKRLEGMALTRRELDDCSRYFQEYGALLSRKAGKDIPPEEIPLADRAEHYVNALRMAALDPDRHGGWPVHHFALKDVDPVLRKRAEAADAEPVRLAAAIVPALLSGRTPEAVQRYRALADRDPFWAGAIAGIIRDTLPQAREFLAAVDARETEGTAPR